MTRGQQHGSSLAPVHHLEWEVEPERLDDPGGPGPGGDDQAVTGV